MSTDTPARDGSTDQLPAHLRPAYEILLAGAAQVLPVGGLPDKLVEAERAGRPLRVKYGIDPSGAQLTLGHAVVLRKLRQFQDLGHTAVLIVGDFTGQVGDPSEKTQTRSTLTAEQTAANSATYFDQVMRILDPDRVEVRRNSEWLAGMSMADVLANARALTVAQLLERDDFSRRYRAGQPISLMEFLYPLLQGYDSVAVRSDVELGGTDQTYNNLVGREIQRAHGQPPQVVLTMPLLVGLDGVEKMGKSLNNFVAIEEPAAEQFGKLMSLPDAQIAPYAELCASLPPAEVAQLSDAARSGGPAANRAKRQVARAVVALYHGAEQAAAAEERFDAVFRHGDVPDDLPVHQLDRTDPVHLPALLVTLGFAASTSQARRLLDEGAVKLDGTAVPARCYDRPRRQVAGRTLAVGKRKMARLSE